MRRSYRAERYLGIIDRVRSAIPHAAITTDLIVGFPGETEEDFAATLDVVRAGQVRQCVHLPVLQAAGYPGRRAARSASESRCARTLHERSHRAFQERDLARGERRNQIGRTVVELLVATGEGRKDSQHRADERDARATAGWCTSPLVNAQHPRPGDVVTTTDDQRRPAPSDGRQPRSSTTAEPAQATPMPAGNVPA